MCCFGFDFDWVMGCCEVDSLTLFKIKSEFITNIGDDGLSDSSENAVRKKCVAEHWL